MYEYKCIEGYPSVLAAELTRLSEEGWAIVGQPIMKNEYVVFATLCRVI